jgi:hypothetical protein
MVIAVEGHEISVLWTVEPKGDLYGDIAYQIADQIDAEILEDLIAAGIL